MKNQENLKQMLKNRIKDLDKQLMSFDPSKHLSYAQFEAYVDEVYPPVTVGQYAFMPSKVLFNLNMTAFHEMFKDWADTVDYEDIPAYNAIIEDREQTLDWLEELS